MKDVDNAKVLEVEGSRWSIRDQKEGPSWVSETACVREVKKHARLGRWEKLVSGARQYHQLDSMLNLRCYENTQNYSWKYKAKPRKL